MHFPHFLFIFLFRLGSVSDKYYFGKMFLKHFLDPKICLDSSSFLITLHHNTSVTATTTILQMHNRAGSGRYNSHGRAASEHRQLYSHCTVYSSDLYSSYITPPVRTFTTPQSAGSSHKLRRLYHFDRNCTLSAGQVYNW